MRIGIMAAGAVGGYFGTRLAAAAHAVEPGRSSGVAVPATTGVFAALMLHLLGQGELIR